MSPRGVTLLPLSNVTHLRQIFTGFHALQRQRRLAVRYADGARHFGLVVSRDLDRQAYCLGAEVDGVGLLVYDVHDSDVVDPTLLERCVLYFKRSYNSRVHDAVAKVRPLGLNLLFEDRPSLVAAWRAMRFGRGRTRYGDVLRALGVTPPYSARDADLVAGPRAQREPNILFLTRAWEPEGFYGATLQETQDRRALNEMRADCIRRLRAAFGEHFVGGFARDAYALAHYADVVVAPGVPTRKDLYLASLARFDICVATRGLLGSTGWKFAEYLAKGRAIVCEDMIMTAPGPLQAGVNYLPFATPQDCVRGVQRLVDDYDNRQAMMVANRAYFDAYVRPDALVERTIATALANVVRR